MQAGLVKRDIQDADYIGYLPFKGNAELRSKCVLEIAPEFYTLTNPVSLPFDLTFKCLGCRNRLQHSTTQRTAVEINHQ